MREGKSEKEIAFALTEWQLRQEEIKARKEEKKKLRKKVAAKSQILADAEESDESKLDEESKQGSGDTVAPEEVKGEAETQEETPAEESVEEESPEEVAEVLLANTVKLQR